MGVDADRLLMNDDEGVSAELRASQDESFAAALRDAVNGIADLHEQLGDVIDMGDTARYVGVRRKAAAWRVTLDSLRNDLLRQHNTMVGEGAIRDDDVPEEAPRSPRVLLGPEEAATAYEAMEAASALPDLDARIDARHDLRQRIEHAFNDNGDGEKVKQWLPK
jgi:hypothetical protein